MVTKKFLLAAFLASLIFGAFALKAQYIPFSFWMSAPVSNEISGPICVDGEVYTSLYHDNKIFLGGNFTRMGQCSGGGALLNNTTGGLATLYSSLAKVDGSIYAITSDENEGWYIGGNFSSVNGMPYTKNIAHIDSDGQLNMDWNPVAVDNTIRALAYDSATNTLFAGGDFAGSFNSVQTSGAAVDIATGQSLGSEESRVQGGPGSGINKVIPNPNGGFYIAGSFRSVGDQTRLSIAKVDPAGHLVEDLNIPFEGSSEIFDICLFNEILYFVGSFSSIGGVPRSGVAAWDLTTNSLTAFNPSIIQNVRACAIANNNKIYLSGDFKNVNIQQVSALGAFDRLTGVFKGSNAPKMDGIISTIIPDGSGGWYIAGNFSYVPPGGAYTRARFLHLLSDFSIDTSFPIIADAEITTLTLGSNRLYLAGGFTQVNGESHPHLAAIDLSTKTVVSGFAPNVNDPRIFDMVEYGSYLYIGGFFTQVDNNSNYKFLARLDINTGAAQPWLGGKIVNLNDSVSRILVDSTHSRLYVAGAFTGFYGVSSNKRFVALDLTTGNTIAAFQSSPNGPVLDIAFDSQNIYLAGEFTNIKTLSRNHLAALDITTGNLSSWNPDTDGTQVAKISQTTDSLFAIGDFTTVGGVTRNSIAEVSKLTIGGVTPWVQNLPNMQALASDTNSVLVAANDNKTFELGGFARQGLASFDSTTGSVTSSWNPSLTSSGDLTIPSISILDNSTLYFSGSFDSVNGTARHGLAALDIEDSNSLSSFAPEAPSSTNFLTAILATNDAVYLSGEFDHIGTTPRNRFAAFDPSSGVLQTLDLSFDQRPEEFAVLDDHLYALGCFQKVNNTRHPFIAQIDKASGSLTSWNPGVNSCANSISFYQTYAYIGGAFSSIGGKNSPAIVAYDTTNGSLKDWNSPFDIGSSISSVNDLALNGSTLYVGGANLSIDNNSVGVVALDTNTGNKMWSMPSDDSVQSLLFDSNVLYVGGRFEKLNGVSQAKLAAIDTTTQQVKEDWKPTLFSSVGSLEQFGGSILAGGSGLSSNQSLIQIDKTSAAITTFPSTQNLGITDLKVKDNIVYVSGIFKTVSATERSHLAAFNINTKGLSSWNPMASNIVFALGVNSNSVYVGGVFDFVGGQQQRGLLALNANNGKALIWNPDVSLGDGAPEVRAFAASGDTLYIGGNFDKVASNNSTNIASIKISTAEANSFSFPPNDQIHSLFLKNNKLYLGGAFSEINGNPRAGLASIDLSTNTLTDFAPVFDKSDWPPLIYNMTGNDSTLFIAGEFCVSGENYCFVTGFDYTGAHQAIDYKLDERARALALDGNTLYIGGDFSTINGFSSPYLASASILTGLPLSWEPKLGDPVYSLGLTSNFVYAGGYFRSAGGKVKFSAAAIDRLTGLANNWTPLVAPANDSINSTVYTITPYALGSKVFIGGNNYYSEGPPEGVRQKTRSSFMIVDDLLGTPVF